MLNPKKRYLQIALNSTLDEAYKIIQQLPRSDRIIVEAGTPLIKRYGIQGISTIRQWYQTHLQGQFAAAQKTTQNILFPLLRSFIGKSQNREYTSEVSATRQNNRTDARQSFSPYIVADLKMMDRGQTEVELAAAAGASAAIALGVAPTESLNAFVAKCEELDIDAMIDMMNVEFPIIVLSHLKKLPRVVILHRGVDEESFNKEKQLPLYQIQRIKGSYNMMIAVAGGDSLREMQRAVFNDADIVVVWKSFFQSTQETGKLAQEFLDNIL